MTFNGQKVVQAFGDYVSSTQLIHLCEVGSTLSLWTSPP